MLGNRSCIERSERTSTEPSPTPASNTRTAGGRGWMLPSSSATRLATTHFSEQVFLPVIEETEIALRILRARRDRDRPVGALRRAQRSRALDHQRAGERRL